VKLSHPELAESVRKRLIELELAGEITESLLNELRDATYGAVEHKASACWKLGRALQKRAADLLAESVAAFQSAAEAESKSAYSSSFPVGLVRNHATVLEELTEDLRLLIQQVERRWASPRALADIRNVGLLGKSTAQAGTSSHQSERTIRDADGRSVHVVLTYDAQGCNPQMTVDGEQLALTHTEQLLIRRHEERINAILLESLQKTQAAKSGGN
jgi:hypothetical protein